MGNITRTNVLECLNPSACIGDRGFGGSSASKMDVSRYCMEGHKDACCSVCADGYRRFSWKHLCFSCDGQWSIGASLVL